MILLERFLDRTDHSGLKLAGALMSHSSLSSFFRLSVRVLLQGLWQKGTKSSGHWYVLVFLTVDPSGPHSLGHEYNNTQQDTKTRKSSTLLYFKYRL